MSLVSGLHLVDRKQINESQQHLQKNNFMHSSSSNQNRSEFLKKLGDSSFYSTQIQKLICPLAHPPKSRPMLDTGFNFKCIGKPARAPHQWQQQGCVWFQEWCVHLGCGVGSGLINFPEKNQRPTSCLPQFPITQMRLLIKKGHTTILYHIH